MLKVTAVSYLNTKPFLYGLLSSPLMDHLEIDLAIPSECARKLKSGEAEIGLVPVAVLPELKDYKIISRFGIGCEGPVASVCLFSDVPVQEITEIYLDYHSRTSVELLQILVREYWKINPTFLHGTKGFEDNIKGSTAGLIIGDRALEIRNKFSYIYDLGEAWYEWANLPFVFAVWVSVKPLDPLVSSMFEQALASGIQQIDKVIKILPSPENHFDLKKYFTENISYTLDENKIKALDLFLQKMTENSSGAKEFNLQSQPL
jgi:chorismate dehydratase